MTSTFSQAFCNRAPTAVSPMCSMVVILALCRLPTGVWHERWAAPFTWTVQAPQRPAPHPYLVPMRPSSSRNTHNKGISGGASNWCTCPLICSSYFIALLHPEDDSCLVCADRELAGIDNGLHRIDGEIQQNALQFAGITGHCRRSLG